MAQFTLHLRVITYDPAAGENVGVPQAQVRLRDRGRPAASLSGEGNGTADAQGRLSFTVSFGDDVDQPRLRPSINIQVPEASRSLLGTGIQLPSSWDTAHEHRDASLDPSAHGDQAHELELWVGLPIHLELAYCDFHESGKRNPMALPEQTLRIHMADEDLTGCWRWLNPEDVMKGRIANRDHSENIDLGLTDSYPYYDKPAPWEPYHAVSDPFVPRAWVHPPGLPVSWLGGTSFNLLGPMCTDPHGFVFVIDGDQVHRFYPDGTHVETLSDHVAGACCVVTDSRRNLFVGVNGFHNVGVAVFNYANDQGSLARVGSAYGFHSMIREYEVDPLTFPEPLDHPVGLALSRDAEGRDQLVVAQHNASANRRRVVVFDLINDDGPVERTISRHEFGVSGSPVVSIYGEVSGVAAAPDGTIFVADRALNRIWRHHGTDPVTFWGRPDGTAGNDDHAFNQPESLAYDAKQQLLYVLDRGNNRLLRLNPTTGDRVLVIATPEPTRYCVDPRGDLYLGLAAAAVEQRRIQRYTVYSAAGAALPTDEPPLALGAAWHPRGQGDRLHQPSHLHVDQARRLWVCDSGSDRVLSFDLLRDGQAALRDVSLTGLARPVATTTDRQARIYVAEAGAHRIQRFSGTPLAGATIHNATGLAGMCCAVKQSTEVLLAIDGNQIKVLDLDGADVGSLHPPEGESFAQPVDLCHDGLGKTWVLERQPPRLLCLGSADNWDAPMRAVALDLPGGDLLEPTGVWGDPLGRLYLTDKGRHLVYMLDGNGGLLAYWDMEHLLRQRLRSVHKAEEAGQVTLADPDHRRPTQLYYGGAAWEITRATRLTLTKATGSPQIIELPPKSIVLVDHQARVQKLDRIAATPDQQVFEPDLARLLLLHEPARAVTDGKGLMFVADPARDRVRMLRIHNDLEAIVLEPDERFPDIAIHTRSRADWTSDLSLSVTVGDETWYGERAFEHMTEAGQENEENYAGDRYRRRIAYSGSERLHEACNTMRVVRQLQRWLMSYTREDGDHRWDQTTHHLLADVSLDTAWSVQPWEKDVMRLATDTSGRGADTWDDDVIVHEMGHWVCSKSLPRTTMSRLEAAYDQDRHEVDQRTHQAHALLEGYAEYLALYWEGSADRVRGFSQSWLARPFRMDQHENRIVDTDLFGVPESYLVVEGYYANLLYQLQQLVVCPGIVFADHSAYHYRFNHQPSTALATLFAQIFRQSLRDFPPSPGEEDAGRPIFVHLRQLRARFVERLPAYVDHFDAICALNNLVLPRLSLSRNGAPAPAQITLHAGDSLELVAHLEDAWGNHLAGYSLASNLGGSNAAFGALAAPAAGAPFLRGHRSLFAQHNATTGADGRQTLHFTAPAVPERREWTLSVSYQPNFYTDPAFTSVPIPGDDLVTVARKTYLAALGRSAGQATGAEVRRAITLVIEP